MSEPEVDLTETRQPVIRVTIIVSYVLAFAAVLLRLTARRIKRLPFWIDDFLIVVGLMTSTAYQVITLIGLKDGLGRHYQTIDKEFLEVLRVFFRYLFTVEIIYTTTITLIKLSILAFYWRIFQVTSIRWPIRITTGIVACWFLTRIGYVLFHCRPVNAYWDKSIKNGCNNNTRWFYFMTGIVHIILDIILLGLPIRYVRSLHMARAQKFVVSGIFLLGGFVCAISIVLLLYIYRLVHSADDITWGFGPIAFWTGVEMNLAIVSACLPSLRPIYLLLFKRGLRADRSHRSNYINDGFGSGRMHGSMKLTDRMAKGSDTDSIHPLASHESDAKFAEARLEPKGHNADIVAEAPENSEDVVRSPENIFVQKEITIERSENHWR